MPPEIHSDTDWIESLNPYDGIKHRNAIDLNFKPTDKRLCYRLPKYMNDEVIVDLTASGYTQHFILKTCLKQLAQRLKEFL